MAPRRPRTLSATRPVRSNTRRVDNRPEAISQFLTRIGVNGQSSAVLEATRNWTVMHDWLEGMVDEVHLAHPLKVKAIAEAKIKTDKIDAKVLAHLLRCDLLPEAYVPSQAARQARNVLRQRMFFIRVRTMVKNRIWHLLDRYPELANSRPCEELFSRQGLSWLKTISVKGPDREMLDEELKLYEALEERISQSDQLVKKLARGDKRVKLLETIPGIGEFFAVLIANEVDNIRRFSNEKKFFSYIGIVPSTFSSGGRTFRGRLTKQGNKYLRWALVEAIWPAVRSDPELGAYYQSIRARKGPNPAKIATARRLATIIYRVLRQERSYRACGSRLPSLQPGGLRIYRGRTPEGE
ncbi:MAG: IS110 family transposase [candidate division WOR-3 bacterium]